MSFSQTHWLSGRLPPFLILIRHKYTQQRDEAFNGRDKVRQARIVAEDGLVHS